MSREIGERNQLILEKYYVWKDTLGALKEPKTKAMFAQQNGVSYQTLNIWDKLGKNGEEEAEELPPATEHEILMKNLKNRASEKNCPAPILALYADLKGYRTKEKEAEIVLTADDIIKASLKADKYLRDKGYAVLEDGGMASMQKKP